MKHCTRLSTPSTRHADAMELLRWSETLLESTGIIPARAEARRLWEAVGGDPPWRLERGARVVPALAAHYGRLVRARSRRVPLAYLTRSVGFMGFELLVRPGVFIPRPETEELAELATSMLQRLPPNPRALDLGTGSGALACALARARPDVRVLAVDVALCALSCARDNARRLGVSKRVETRRSDWFASVPERFHLITANPPYIGSAELCKLEPEVHRHEPPQALCAGKDGLEALRTILAGLPSHLLPGGQALVEIGHGQAQAALALAKGVPGLVETEVRYDMGGRARILAVRWM
ncbi:MAG: peptide chain release factor N(5)-glutamine methyltransferase [Candidatus Bipolaricaulota bacterium]